MDKWDKRFLDMAKLVSTWSKDPSTQTGAVIVDSKKVVVSVCFNGFPQSMPDRDEDYANREEKYSRVVHCEMNALVFARRDLTGCTVYGYPMLFCDRCFVHLVQAGISRFVAPIANKEKLERWGKYFEKTRRYAKECNVELVELPYEVA